MNGGIKIWYCNMKSRMQILVGFGNYFNRTSILSNSFWILDCDIAFAELRIPSWGLWLALERGETVSILRTYSSL